MDVQEGLGANKLTNKLEKNITLFSIDICQHNVTSINIFAFNISQKREQNNIVLSSPIQFKKREPK